MSLVATNGGMTSVAKQLEALEKAAKNIKEAKKMIRKALTPMKASVKASAPVGDGGPDGKHMRDTVHYTYEEQPGEITGAVQLGWPDRILNDGWMITGHKPGKPAIRWQPGDRFFKRATIKAEREVEAKFLKLQSEYWGKVS